MRSSVRLISGILMGASRGGNQRGGGGDNRGETEPTAGTTTEGEETGTAIASGLPHFRQKRASSRLRSPQASQRRSP